jgi:hypothetical protein
MDACFSYVAQALLPVRFSKPSSRRIVIEPRNRTGRSARATKNLLIVILRNVWRAGKEADRNRAKRVSLLDSAPPDPSDDSRPVLTKPPSRLGGTAVGDFGGNFCCTFRLASEAPRNIGPATHCFRTSTKTFSRYHSDTRAVKFQWVYVARASSCGGCCCKALKKTAG